MRRSRPGAWKDPAFARPPRSWWIFRTHMCHVKSVVYEMSLCQSPTACLLDTISFGMDPANGLQSICRAWLHEAACSKQVVGKIVATIACRGYMDVWMPDALMLLKAFPSACVSLTDVEVADDLTTLIDTANAPIFGINVHGRASHLDCCS